LLGFFLVSPGSGIPEALIGAGVDLEREMVFGSDDVGNNRGCYDWGVIAGVVLCSEGMVAYRSSEEGALVSGSMGLRASDHGSCFRLGDGRRSSGAKAKGKAKSEPNPF
jgi:hypothetical protein